MKMKKKNMKSIIALSLVIVSLLGITVTAFAYTKYPTECRDCGSSNITCKDYGEPYVVGDYGNLETRQAFTVRCVNHHTYDDYYVIK